MPQPEPPGPGPTPPPETIDTAAAARLLGTTPHAVRMLVADGRLAAIRPPRRRGPLRLDLAEVQALAGSRRARVAAVLDGAWPDAPRLRALWRLRGRPDYAAWAARCGVNPQLIGRYMAGTKRPTSPTLDRLLSGLGAGPVDWDRARRRVRPQDHAAPPDGRTARRGPRRPRNPPAPDRAPPVPETSTPGRLPRLPGLAEAVAAAGWGFRDVAAALEVSPARARQLLAARHPSPALAARLRTALAAAGHPPH